MSQLIILWVAGGTAPTGPGRTLSYGHIATNVHTQLYYYLSYRGQIAFSYDISNVKNVYLNTFFVELIFFSSSTDLFLKNSSR